MLGLVHSREFALLARALMGGAMVGGEGTTFGKYYLLKKLATGGMGEIYLAKLRGPVGFEKLLVIKRILAEHIDKPEFVDMFFAEARIAAQLNHSNIVQIYEMGQIESSYFIGMEYVYGKSLRDVLDRSRERGEYIHPEHVAHIIADLCEGLAYAHSAKDLTGRPLGIIHRDINPQNIIISYAGEVKLIDFGIAKSDLPSQRGDSKVIKGKVSYMSPEQSAGKRLGKQSDVFSTGICLYETLTYISPFAKGGLQQSVEALQTQDPPLVSHVDAKLGVFDDIVARALAKDPSARYQDCFELARALRQLVRKGALATPHLSLADYMYELFEDTIESERRMIASTDQANTIEIQAMHDYQAEENRLGMRRPWIGPELAAPVVNGPPPRASVPPPRSRKPFWLALSSILIATAAGVFGTTKYAPAGGRLFDRNANTIALVELAEDPPPAPEPKAAPSDNAPPPEVAVYTIDSPAMPMPQGEGESDEDAATADDLRGGRNNRRPQRPGRTETKPAEPAAQAFGVLRISTNPAVPIFLGGASASQTLRLRAAKGTIVVGRGSDSQSDPFKITIDYSLVNDRVSYSINADPWAIVRSKGGIGLGRTPLAQAEADDATVFDFANPEGRKLHISLNYTGP